jgi:hypothetical protein
MMLQLIFESTELLKLSSQYVVEYGSEQTVLGAPVRLRLRLRLRTKEVACFYSSHRNMLV